MPGSRADGLVLDRWFCGGNGVAANPLGQLRLMLCPVPVLFNKIPRGLAVEILPAGLFIACHMGSSPRFAHFHDQTVLGNRSGSRRHRVDDHSLEQQPPALVDSQLGVEFAGVVSGRDLLEIYQSSRAHLKCQGEFMCRYDVPLGNSWSVNSPVTRNWDDFVVKRTCPVCRRTLKHNLCSCRSKDVAPAAACCSCRRSSTRTSSSISPTSTTTASIKWLCS